jgi:N-methylhydantoinase A
LEFVVWTVGIDVGGTFTDLFAENRSTGEARTGKVLTTPADRVIGVVASIEAAGLQASDIALLVHGTTTATNALIERNYPEAAMITTEGFRDVLEIGRMHREHLYRPYQKKPQPLIRRRNRFVLNERVNAEGVVEQTVQHDEVAQIIDRLRESRVRSVAICLINSYANDANEKLVADQVKKALPDIAVVTSAEVKPVFREHTRFSTAVVRAVLLPVMATYFERLEQSLRDRGFAGHLMILKSNGGMMSILQARTRVEELVESGPAGGVGYAAEIAETTGYPNIIHTDVGGTSFDTSILEDGKGLVTREYEVEFDIPVAVPMLDIRSIGAGGGSVGWIDDGGSLRVGPKSAGSEPGPACYGRGGSKPTITDANLVLGRLSPDLSGKFSLDVDAARKAVATLAAPLGMSVEDCAEGMIRIATESMAQAVKIVLASRGRDPRDYALASFGGAGPMHACAVATALQAPAIIVPRYSGVASAYGATCLSLKHDEEVFHFARLDEGSLLAIATKFRALESKCLHALIEQGAEENRIRTVCVMRMRYAGQTFEVDVEQDAGDFVGGKLTDIEEAFHKAHKREFGVRSDEFPVEVVAISATAEAAAPVQARPPRKDVGCIAADVSPIERSVYFDARWITAPVMISDALDVGVAVSGPAIIEDMHTCIVVPPDWTARLDDRRNFIMEKQ